MSGLHPKCKHMVLADYRCVFRVGQSRIYTLYMTIHFVIYLPKIPYIHRKYKYGSGQPYVYMLRSSSEKTYLCNVARFLGPNWSLNLISASLYLLLIADIKDFAHAHVPIRTQAPPKAGGRGLCRIRSDDELETFAPRVCASKVWMETRCEKRDSKHTCFCYVRSSLIR